MKVEKKNWADSRPIFRCFVQETSPHKTDIDSWTNNAQGLISSRFRYWYNLNDDNLYFLLLWKVNLCLCFPRLQDKSLISTWSCCWRIKFFFVLLWKNVYRYYKGEPSLPWTLRGRYTRTAILMEPLLQNNGS